MHPQQAARELSSLTVPWWIAGGWAIDLHLGVQTRPHADLDIGILRSDSAALMKSLASWEFFEASEGWLTRIDAGQSPRPQVNSMWCRPAHSTGWMLDVLLDSHAGEEWQFRRQPCIKRPLAAVVRVTAQGVPYLAPEIQLLYKARTVRNKDQRDFDRIAPQMDSDALVWLREAIEQLYPKHPWLRSLPSISGPALGRSPRA